MAEILRVNGTTTNPAQQVVGRDVRWLEIVVTGDLTALVDANAEQTYLDLVRQVVDSASTVTITGQATATGVMFFVESIGFGGAGSAVEPEAAADVTDADQLAAIEALVDAIPTLSGTAAAFRDIVGIAFV